MIDLRNLKQALEQEKDILFAYLFGSVALNRAHKESDLDVAIYLKDIKDKKELQERKLELILKIMDTTRFNQIDLVVLNEAPPLLVFSVFKTGKLLFSKDEEKRIKFMARNLLEFCDLQITLRPCYEAMKRRIKEGKFGL